MLQDEVMVPLILNPSGEDAEPVARLSKVVDLRGGFARGRRHRDAKQPPAATDVPATTADGRAGNNRLRLT
jgi:hypothetical protein